MLALHGFNVTGLEISSKGVSTAREYARAELDQPQGYNFRSGLDKNDTQRGTVEFVQGDFFDSDSDSLGKFDVVYDYTVRYLLLSLFPLFSFRQGRLTNG